MFATVSESVDAYDEFIREVSGDVSLLGVDYDPATILNAIDPIAYKCGWIDYMDALGVDTDELEDDYAFDRDRLLGLPFLRAISDYGRAGIACWNCNH